MRLLIDGNIVLDVLQNRKEHVKDSAKIWKLCETEQAEGYVSALTFANLVYVMRKELTPESIGEVLNKLSLLFQFTELSAADLSKAAEMKWDDFEDALQSATAERVHADYLITRNVRDFQRSIVPALSPADYLSQMF
ncbi:MAG: PIN domain-containing protein [Oscillospiraceae bacterium]|nr:PIN domain-containing protein [Oscillospiraceae bacterium]